MSELTNDAAKNCHVCGAPMRKNSEGVYECKEHGVAVTEDGVVACPKCGAPMTKNLEGDLICKACATARTSDAADVVRHDVQWAVSADDYAEAEMMGYVKKFTKDSNGFLRGQAPVTSIGVFSYMLPNGTVRRELRLPGEVFKRDSLDSLRMVPLTNEHPEQGVSPATAKDLQKGSIGDGVMNDAYRIYAPICITDSALIADIESGKRALSCGYICDLEDKAGVWNGVAYDAVQRNIRYNHVAVVTRGRAGDDATMKLDSANPHQMYRVDGTQQVTKPEDKTMNKKITVDSADFEVPEAVALHVAKQDAAISQAKADAAKLEAERDSHKDRADKAEADLKAHMDGMPAQIDAAVKSRMDLAAKAAAYGVEIKSDMADSDIKKAIVLHAFPKQDSARLDDAAYLTHRFDFACEALDAVKEQKQDSAANSNAALGAVVNADGCGMGKKKPQEMLEDSKKKYEENLGKKA